jgi:hypothetical protein
MDTNFALCLTCLKYSTEPDRPGQVGVSPLTDPGEE